MVFDLSNTLCIAHLYAIFEIYFYLQLVLTDLKDMYIVSHNNAAY